MAYKDYGVATNRLLTTRYIGQEGQLALRESTFLLQSGKLEGNKEIISLFVYLIGVFFLGPNICRFADISWLIKQISHWRLLNIRFLSIARFFIYFCCLGHGEQ